LRVCFFGNGIGGTLDHTFDGSLPEVPSVLLRLRGPVPEAVRSVFGSKGAFGESWRSSLEAWSRRLVALYSMPDVSERVIPSYEQSSGKSFNATTSWQSGVILGPMVNTVHRLPASTERIRGKASNVVLEVVSNQLRVRVREVGADETDLHPDGGPEAAADVSIWRAISRGLGVLREKWV